MNYGVDDSAIYLTANSCADRNPRLLIGQNVDPLCHNFCLSVVKFYQWLAIHRYFT